jgi:hypothetical protein
MSTCGTCRGRRADGVDAWCPICGAALVPDARCWDLGDPAPSSANTVKPTLGLGAAFHPDPEARARLHRWRVAVLIVLALALLAGISARAYLLLRTQSPYDTAETTVVSSQPADAQASVETYPHTAPSENYVSATTLVPASNSAHRFLTYDASIGKYGYADETGTLVIEAHFERAGQFLDGLAPVELQSESGSAAYGYIDATGAMVIEPQFKTAFAFCEGLARVEVAVNGLDRYGFIDRSGTMVIEPQYVAAGDFSQGLARVRSNDASGLDGYGFIDRTGMLVIGSRFGSARDFSEGLAAVAVDGKWGYIDRTGNWVIEPRFPDAESFVASGLAAVDLEDPGAAGENTLAREELGLHQALIDKTGTVVWERQTEQE